jgi:hypothetical protein
LLVFYGHRITCAVNVQTCTNLVVQAAHIMYSKQ